MTTPNTPVPSSESSAEASDSKAGRCAVAAGSVGYIPERWTVLKDDVYAAISALEAGIEFSREALANHDRDVGRTIRKNQWWAEQIEAGIAEQESILERLKKYSRDIMPSPNKD